MNVDVAYSLLIDLAWFFLGSWVVLLAAAYVLVFDESAAKAALASFANSSRPSR
jgi:hypothetical protein